MKLLYKGYTHVYCQVKNSFIDVVLLVIFLLRESRLHKTTLDLSIYELRLMRLRLGKKIDGCFGLNEQTAELKVFFLAYYVAECVCNKL